MTLIKWGLAALYTIGILCIVFGNDITGSWREGIVQFGYATVGISAFVTFTTAILSYRTQDIETPKNTAERSKY